MSLQDLLTRFGPRPSEHDRLQHAADTDQPVPFKKDMRTGKNLWIVSEDYLEKVADLKKLRGDP